MEDQGLDLDYSEEFRHAREIVCRGQSESSRDPIGSSERDIMIHYHVWFDLKAGVPEAKGLSTVGRFLQNLCAVDEAATFQLLRNKGGPPRSRLPRYHALIQFMDDTQLADAMKQQTARGIHGGVHGEVIDVVTDFHVEVFSVVGAPIRNAAAGLLACEI